MANRKTLITNVSLVVALVVVAALVWWFVAPHDSAQADPAAATERTATVSVGEVSATISAQGNIEAGATKQVNFAVSGVLDSVDVKVGDTVQEGDVLATVTSESVDESISQAQETYNEAADEVTAAKKTLSSAKSDLSDAQDSYSQAVADAKTAKAAATSTQSTVSSALQTADTQSPETESAEKSGTATNSGNSDAQSNTQSNAVSSTASAVSSAKQQVSSAQSKVDSAQSSLTKANKTLTKAEEALADAKALTDDTTLTAPMSGIITAVGSQVGDSVSSGSSSSSAGSSSASGSNANGSGSSSSGSTGFITIANTTTMVINASFDEADAAALAVGQSATVTFPAVEGVEVTGTVTEIDPVGTTSGSVVTFGAVITLEDVPASIRIGQTATLSVVTAQAQDVLAATSQAVTVTSTDEDGTVHGTVTVVSDDGTHTLTDVVIGVQGDSMTQLVSGVDEGAALLVSVDTAVGETTSTNQMSVPGGGNFPGGSSGSFPGGSSGSFPGGSGGGNGGR